MTSTALYRHHNGDAMSLHSNLGLEREDDSGIESGAHEPSESTVYIRINIPELKLEVRNSTRILPYHPF